MDRSESPSVVDRPSFFRNVAALLAHRYGSKALEALLLAYAFRTLPDRAVGLAFFVQASAGIVFQSIDLGLVPVITRRAAWGRVGGPLLVRLTIGRSLGVVILSLGYAAYAARAMGADATIAAGLFFAAGLQSVHDVPRAAAAGLERFGRLSAIGLLGKAIEVGTAIAGFVLGLGLPSWFAGRVANHVVVGALSIPLARSSVRDATSSATVSTVVREGLPFWWSTLLSLLAIRLDTIFVAVFAGLEETAQIGVASRVLGGVLGVVSAATFAAFPRLARDRRRFIRRREALFVTAIAIAIGAGVFACAPLVVRIVEGRFDEGTIDAVRAMAPMATIFALSRPLETWLQAKRQEWLLSKVATVHVGLVALLLAILVPRFGAEGAAIARPIRAAIEFVGLAVAAALALAPVPSPIGYRLGSVAWLRALMRSRHTARWRREERRLLASADIERVSSTGVSLLADEPGFAQRRIVAVGREGASVRVRGERIRTLAGRIDVLVLDRTTANAIDRLAAPATDPELARRIVVARRIVDACRAFLAMQRIALAQSRPDGRIRVDLLELEARLVRAALGDPGPRDESTPDAPRPELGYVDGQHAGRLLAAAYRRLDDASVDVGDPGRDPRAQAASPEPPASIARLVAAGLCDVAVVVPLGPGTRDPLTVVDALAFGSEGAADAFARFVRIVGPEADPDERPESEPVVLPASTLALVELLGDPPLAAIDSTRAPVSLRGAVTPRRNVGDAVRRALAIESLVGIARERLLDGDERSPFRVDARVRLARRDRSLALLRELGFDAPEDPIGDVELDERIRHALVALAGGGG